MAGSPTPHRFMKKARRLLSPRELPRLERWNTPTLYNGWEQITGHHAAADGFNLEEARDFRSQIGRWSATWSLF